MATKRTLMRPDILEPGASRPVVNGIQPSVVYASETPDALDAQYEGRVQGYTYAREGHPNATLLANAIARMEGMEDGLTLGSGMAAVTAVLMGLCRAGDHVLGGDQLYGRSLRLMNEDLPRLGIATSLADPTDAAAFAAALRPETKLVLIEVVSNPTLRVADIDGIAELCRAKGVTLVVDNTFTTPTAIRPVDHGADIVIHSVTKLLLRPFGRDAGLGRGEGSRAAQGDLRFRGHDGHDAVALRLLARGTGSHDLRSALCPHAGDGGAAGGASGRAGGCDARSLPDAGGSPGPGSRARAPEGAGLQHGQFRDRRRRAAANAFTKGADVLAFAPTLGDVSTTLSHPASSSHRALSPEARAKLGISEGFFRVSVGLEEPEALLAAFDAGLAAARSGAA